MDVHITEMIKAMKAEGHEVFLVAPSLSAEGFGEHGGWIQSVRQRLPRFAAELLEFAYNLTAYRDLVRAIRTHAPDVIYERYALFLVAGILAKRRFGLPMVLEVNSPLFEERSLHGGLLLRRLGKWSENFAWKNADYCLPVTEVLARTMRIAGVAAERLRVIPNGIDPSRFDLELSPNLVREKYGLGDHIVLGFSGFVRPWHGIDKIIRLIAEVSEKFPVKLLMVGDGPIRGDLERLADSLGIRRHVIFTGVVQRNEIADHIAAFDIALQPDATEYASPLKLIEYMSMGKAILAPDQANIRELLEHGQTALLFDKKSFGGLRDALMQLVADSEMRRRLGSAAAAQVRGRPLTWRENARKVCSLFGLLLS